MSLSQHHAHEIRFFALLALLLPACAKFDPSGQTAVIYDQPVTITEVGSKAKTTRVYWCYDLPLPNGGTIRLYGRNGSDGNNYKTFRLVPGQVVRRTVVLRGTGYGIQADALSFADYTN